MERIIWLLVGYLQITAGAFSVVAIASGTIPATVGGLIVALAAPPLGATIVTLQLTPEAR